MVTPPLKPGSVIWVPRPSCGWKSPPATVSAVGAAGYTVRTGRRPRRHARARARRARAADEGGEAVESPREDLVAHDLDPTLPQAREQELLRALRLAVHARCCSTLGASSAAATRSASEGDVSTTSTRAATGAAWDGRRRRRARRGRPCGRASRRRPPPRWRGRARSPRARSPRAPRLPSGRRGICIQSKILGKRDWLRKAGGRGDHCCVIGTEGQR